MDDESQKGMAVYNLVMLFGLLMLALPAYGGIYKWVDEKGDTHFSDVPFKKDNAQKITVDTRGTSYGNEGSRKKERDAIKGINAQKRMVKRNSNKSTPLKQNEPQDPRKSKACIYAKQRLSELQTEMRHGYDAAQRNYLHAKKRRFSEKGKKACQP
jgi:hypothetical protein